MAVFLANQNLLDSDADAVALTIDGTAPNLEGNIARQFAKRYPDAWESIQTEIEYPIPLGAADAIAVTPTDEQSFECVILLSTLHHQLSLSGAEKQAVAEGALRDGLHQAKSHRRSKVACPILSGGWRQQTDQAALQSINTYIRASMKTSLPDLELCVSEKADTDQILELLTSQSYLNLTKLDNIHRIEPK